MAKEAKSIRSDLNRDGVVDFEDLEIYTERKFGADWQSIDWCAWFLTPHKRDRKLVELRAFVNDTFECTGGSGGGEPLRVLNSNDAPLRAALAPDGRIYVTDSGVGSVFIYDPDLQAVGELPGLDRPLGVAVDSVGNIYVGSRGNQRVEIYDSSGAFREAWGEGEIRMPNDLAFGPNGNLHVLDSEAGRVWVYDSNGDSVRTIGSAGKGQGRLGFPISLIIGPADDGSGAEIDAVYVADQEQGLIHVFSLEGGFLRSFGGKPLLDYRGGKFVRLQSLQMDAQGRLHALDSRVAAIQILTRSGAHIVDYGEYGPDSGQLRLPLDIVVLPTDQLAVANHGNERVELIPIP
ncbi:MAG: NHL repeat-containing protein [Planctomycetota bacterium]